MSRRARTALGGLAGVFCFLFIGLDVLLLGLVPLHSPVVTLLPLAGLVLGALWGWWAPLGSGTGSGAGPARRA
jgi:hypothetical protein